MSLVHEPDLQPRLRVALGSESRVFAAPLVTVGRTPDLSIVLTHPDVSRRHLEFRRSGGSWDVVDLGSTNGTWLEGRRVTRERLPSGRATSLSVGGQHGPQLRVEVVPAYAAGPDGLRQPPEPPQPPGQLPHGSTILPSDLPGDTLVIGRANTCDVVLDDPLVSRQHADLRLNGPGGTAALRDLDSFNGTFVNGVRLRGTTLIRAGDEIVLGNQEFVWDGADLVAQSARADLTLRAEGLTKEVRGRRLLDTVTFALPPAALAAVVGPSGSGKSTLLGALTGLQPATRGSVVWQGHDLYSRYDQLRFQIGVVPQSDLLHPQLTVRQGLSYAARLRLPPDTRRAERRARVEDVARRLGLADRLRHRIGTQLSGGQRKRVSIATELLTAPPLLFLDEPTSGLDPGLDRDVMHQLRELADEGRVVVVVTHSVLALDLCDTVLVLAPGGRLAYAGPPAGVLTRFGCADWPEVFGLLERSDAWQPVTPPEAGGPRASVPAHVPAPPRRSWAGQLATLVRRTLAVLAADRLLLALLVLMPLVLAALSRVVDGDAGLSLSQARLQPAEAQQRLTVLVLAASLMGAALPVRELVRERAILQREYAVGLSPGAYLGAKVLVLGTAAYLQGMLLTSLALAGLPGPDADGALGLGVVEVALVMGALAATLAVAGLAVSALARTQEQTMPALVGLVMVQLVLCGALIPLDGRAVLEQLSWVAPARWGFAAAAVSVDLERGARLGGKPTDSLHDPGAGQWWYDVAGLAVVGVLITLLAWLAVRRSVARRVS